MTPDSNAYAQYLALMNRAQGVAATPYQGYGGEEVASINDQQRAGFGNINQASDFIKSQEQPLSAAAINQYMDPYTNQVIDATQRDFDVQNARANSITTGNAGSIGALGGDRSEVAKALTQEQQGRVQAPIIAGLRSAGYQSAVNTAAGQQDKMLRAGVAAQGAAGAQVGAGTLEQQTQQAKDTQGRMDYYQAQGYPFQVAQWLAAIDTGVGSQMGGTSNSTGTATTQGPTPNPWAQVAGVGLTAASMFLRDGGRVGVRGYAEGGAPQGFHDWKQQHAPHDSGEDYDLRGAYEAGILPDPRSGHWPDTFKRPNHPTFSDESRYAVGPDRDRAGHWNGEDFVPPPIKRSGGRIAGFAAGGGPMTGAFPWAGGDTWVPTANIAHGRGAPAAAAMPSPPQAPKQAGLSNDMMKGIGAAGKSLMNMWGTDPGSYEKPMAGLSQLDYDPSGPGVFYRGGGVRRYAAGGGAQFDDETMFDDRFGAAYPNRSTAGFGAAQPAFGEVIPMPRARPAAADADPETDPANGLPFHRMQGSPQEYQSAMRSIDQDRAMGLTAPEKEGPEVPGGLPPEIASGSSRPGIMARGDDGEGAGASSYAPVPRAPPAVIQARGVAAAPSGGYPAGPPDEGFLSRLGVKMTPELKQGLLQAGLAMMATRHGGPGSFLSAAGEAGMTGVGAYNKTQENTLEQENKLRREAFEQEKFDRPYRERTLAERDAAALAKTNAERADTRLDIAEKREARAEADRKRMLEGPMSDAPKEVKEAMEEGKNGGDFLGAIKDRSLRNIVESIGNYDQLPSSVLSKFKGRGEYVMALVKQFNPDWNESWARNQAQTLKNYFANTAPNSPVVQARAYNTAVGHAGELAEAVVRLHKAQPELFKLAQESGVPFLSWAAQNSSNIIQKGTSSEAAAALNQIKAIAPLYVGETTKFYSGSGGSEEEKKTIRAPLEPNLSPYELLEAIRTQAHMFKSKTDPLEQEFREATNLPGLKEYGTKKNFTEWHVTKDHAVKALENIEKLYKEAKPPPPPPGAVSKIKSWITGAPAPAAPVAKATAPSGGFTPPPNAIPRDYNGKTYYYDPVTKQPYPGQ